MNITTEFTDNTGMNLVNPFCPAEGYPFLDYMNALLRTIMRYSPEIKTKITTEINHGNAKISVVMSR